MLTIRLARRGAKKRPFYHIVVTDSRQARDGGAIKESIGYFNPLASQNENSFKIAVDRFNYWLSTGAKPSERVAKLIKLSKKVVSEVSVENTLSPSSDIR